METGHVAGQGGQLTRYKTDNEQVMQDIQIHPRSVIDICVNNSIYEPRSLIDMRFVFHSVFKDLDQ